MPLSRRYHQVRALVEKRFTAYRRRAVADGLGLERIEMWHDLLEAALAADADWPGEADDAWQAHVLAAMEARYAELA